MDNSIWQKKSVTQFYLYFLVSLSMIAISNFLILPSLARGSILVLLIVEALSFGAFIPMFYAIFLWVKAGKPWSLRPMLWRVTFRRPFDKQLLGFIIWAILLAAFDALTLFMFVPH